MRQRSLGAGGRKIARIGQGTWQMELDDRREVVRALQQGIDAGMTHVDTAEMYGDGEVERIVGEAIRGRRDEVFLVSKVLPHNASARGTIEACERSLARLGTERLDLYLLHWPGSHPIAETIGAFEELVERGAIDLFGVSNFDTNELDEAVAAAGPGRIACNQVLYHLKERTVEHYVVPHCEDHEVTVVAYSPFGSGDFPACPVLEEIAAARGATVRQVALAFLTRRDSVVAIPKAASVEHALENAGAGDIVLGEEEIARIEEAFPKGRPRHGVPVI